MNKSIAFATRKDLKKLYYLSFHSEICFFTYEHDVKLSISNQTVMSITDWYYKMRRSSLEPNETKFDIRELWLSLDHL